MTPAQAAVNAEKEALCLAGIDAVDVYADGTTADDLTELLDGTPGVQLESVILYCLMLEMLIHKRGGVTPTQTREAARGIATLWRTRPATTGAAT